jgi:cytochrome b6-f complex iron-sulfur subunit
VERRKLLMFFGVGALANSLPVAIAACSSKLNAAETVEIANNNGFVKVGTVAELDKRGKIDNDDTSVGKILIVRSGTNSQTLVAVDPTCTHQGCTVNWENGSQDFACPCHGAKFDANGQGIAGPSRKPLRTYEAKIVGKSVLVRQN